LIQPFYQKGLLALSRKEAKMLIVAMSILWSVTSIVPFFEYGATNFLCFIMLYAVVFYIRQYQPTVASSKRFYCGLIVGGYVLAFLSVAVMDLLGTKFPMVATYSCYFIRGNWRLLPYVISIGIFMWSIHWKVQSKAINYIASLTFGIYLIHMYPPMMDYLFKSLFNIETIIASHYLPLAASAMILAVFVGCGMVEACRKIVFKFTFDKLEVVRNREKKGV
jgi:hypothetical protein